MSDGEVLENDSPLVLLSDKKSQFSLMVSETGVEASHRLYEMAVEADRRKNTNDSCKPVISSSVYLVTEV